jgi:hypothetical protein
MPDQGKTAPMSDIPVSSEISLLDIRERLARIDQLTADAELKRQEFDLGWHKFYMSAIGTAAALLGAGAGIVALMQHL